MKKLLMLVVTLMLGASLALAQAPDSSKAAEKPAATKTSKKSAKKPAAKKDKSKASSDKKDATSK